MSQLPVLAGRLERADLLATADVLACETEKAITKRAIRLGVIAGLPGLSRRAWHLCVRDGGTPSLVRLLTLLDREGPGLAFLKGDAADRVRPWLREDLPSGLLVDLERSSVSPDSWRGRLPELTTPITRDSSLFLAVRRRVLTEGSSEILSRLGTVVLDWVQELSENSHALLAEDFVAHYLAVFRPGHRWQGEIADWSTERFGTPELSKPVGIWRRIEEAEEGILKEFTSWLALRKLAKFFENVDDPEGRFEFWRENFAEFFESVDLVGRGVAAILHLPPVVVVEFAVPPNAAYVYPESRLRELRAVRSTDPIAYKDKSKLIRRRNAPEGYRIIHVPGWQVRALQTMHSLVSGRRR